MGEEAQGGLRVRGSTETSSSVTMRSFSVAPRAPQCWYEPVVLFAVELEVSAL